MATYHVTLKNGSVEVIEGADAYQQEGQMTTFFETGEQRRIVDCWSTRLASFRTSEVLIIRRVETPVTPSGRVDHERDRGHAPGEPAVVLRTAS